MFGIPWIEWVGYAASVFVAISLLMTEMFKLRVINTVGCLLFAIYGFTVKAYPVGVINVFIVFVNLFYITKMSKNK